MGVDSGQERVADMQAVEDNGKDTQVEVEGSVQVDTVEGGVREELVKTAVKFLENSRVQSSTEEMKREFLVKKGLTEAEIDMAFSTASQVTPFKQVQVQQQPLQSRLPMVTQETTL